MDVSRHHRRLVVDTKVLVSLLDRVNRVLFRLSDRLEQRDHPLSLNEILILCQMLSPRPCKLYIFMISSRSVHWRDCALLLVIE